MILSTARRVAGLAANLPLIGGLFPGQKPPSHSPGSRSKQIPLSAEAALRTVRFMDACREMGRERELCGGKPHPRAHLLGLDSHCSRQPLVGVLTAEEAADEELARAENAAVRARMPKGI